MDAQTPNTVELRLRIPAQLYDKLLRLSQGLGSESAAITALIVLERALGDEPVVIPPEEPFDSDRHLGMGRELFVDDEDFKAFLQASQGPSYMDIAALARPDGETQQVSFRITQAMSTWLEERREVLDLLGELRAFYHTIDTATAARHMLAQELVAGQPLTTPPGRGGQPTVLNIPREMYAKLEARIPEVMEAGARSNAGVGTVIRWVFASAMAKARTRTRTL